VSITAVFAVRSQSLIPIMIAVAQGVRRVQFIVKVQEE
jgi:hypothetical protein